MEFQICSRRESQSRDNDQDKSSFLANNFALSQPKKTLQVHEIKEFSRQEHSKFLFVENTINNSPKVVRATFSGHDRRYCLISISRFGSFKNPLTIISSLPKLQVRSRICILLRSDLYELWQQHKQLKAMEMNEA